MTLPNKITLIRIFMIPLMVFFYLANLIPGGKIVALCLFAVASFTDFLDGYIARKYNLVSDLGKFLDPIADKLLTTTALILVVADGTVPAPYGAIATIIILAREFAISAFRQIAATKNFVMAADWWGKIKTNLQIFSFAALILLSYFNEIGLNGTFVSVFRIINWVLLGLAVALTIISGCNYLIKNRNVLKSTKNDK
ncbi:MAG: CDP-diacylglycerol--glycerol-3-phosphate 3-phosphatidyltransferase [Clostridia bacterium]|nr:CDP-diacylglycerol--glycerol-3-phosphate 3-phosphatidyltransferase [Clostridia bacterium]